MLRIILKLLFFQFLIITYAFAGIEKAESISFGPVQIGENRVPIGINDIEIVKNVSDLKVKAEINKDSFEWVRYNGILLIPRARIRVIIDSNDQNLFLKYKNKTILSQYSSNKLYFSEFYISLFHPDEIEIYIQNKLVGNIAVATKSNNVNNPKINHMIDYSCAPFNVRIEGLDNEYLSVGCILHRAGKFGHEKGMLEIHWTSANYLLKADVFPPYVAIMVNNHPVQFDVFSKKGKIKTVKIYAQVPKKMQRLKTAIGFGPYYFTAQKSSVESKAGWAPTGMIYGKFDISRYSSLKFFDAFVWKDGYFNNSGIYFSYELATALDKRFVVVPLLGVQGLSIKYSSKYDSYHKIIYPQGLELIYKHPFGMKNYSFVFGIFTTASVSEDDYDNMWIRFGKKVFWELNYIGWQNQGRKASMWGLSVGMPFLSFL